MSGDIKVTILGDSGPFSAMGKSIGYLLEAGGKRMLVDCGSPLFVQVGGGGLRDIDALIITHCHDDHKRWFSDLALFFKYAPGFGKPLPLLTSEDVRAELDVASGPAVNTSLSIDSARVIDLSMDDFVAYTPLGPRARYRIVRDHRGEGTFQIGVAGPDGGPADPAVAKVVISPHSGRCRLLYRDPDSGRWVEPISYYALGDPAFYESEPRAYAIPGALRIEPINAPVWHGMPAIGLRISTPTDTLVFSTDTRHDPDLWRRLARPVAATRQGLSMDAFARAAVLYGDINDFIEQTWSERRLTEALAAFADAVTVHDVAGTGSVVHTDYPALRDSVLDRERTLLTHSPDSFTSSWKLSNLEKCFRIENGIIVELVDGEPRQLDADFYHKADGRFFALYLDEAGSHEVLELANGLLSLRPAGAGGEGHPLGRVTVYEDVAGRYLPLPESPAVRYRLRDDGRVVRITEHADGCVGEIVEDLRPTLAERVRAASAV